MNERIKGLAQQTGGHNNISKFWGHFLPPPHGYIDPATVNLEKFAELIVRECTDICEEYSGTVWDEAAQRIAERIKERFGVE